MWTMNEVKHYVTKDEAKELVEIPCPDIKQYGARLYFRYHFIVVSLPNFVIYNQLYMHVYVTGQNQALVAICHLPNIPFKVILKEKNFCTIKHFCTKLFWRRLFF